MEFREASTEVSANSSRETWIRPAAASRFSIKPRVLPKSWKISLYASVYRATKFKASDQRVDAHLESLAMASSRRAEQLLARLLRGFAVYFTRQWKFRATSLFQNAYDSRECSTIVDSLAKDFPLLRVLLPLVEATAPVGGTGRLCLLRHRRSPATVMMVMMMVIAMMIVSP